MCAPSFTFTRTHHTSPEHRSACSLPSQRMAALHTRQELMEGDGNCQFRALSHERNGTGLEPDAGHAISLSTPRCAVRHNVALKQSGARVALPSHSLRPPAALRLGAKARVCAPQAPCRAVQRLCGRSRLKRARSCPCSPCAAPADRYARPLWKVGEAAEWREYLRKMMKNRTWGDEITLRAAVEEYKVHGRSHHGHFRLGPSHAHAPLPISPRVVQVRVYAVTSENANWLLCYAPENGVT